MFTHRFKGSHSWLDVQQLLRAVFLSGAAVSLCSAGFAAETVRLIPVVAHKVTGANGSQWDSEVRLFNGTSSAATVRFQKVLPFYNSTCAPPESVTLQPGALVALQGVACLPESAAAVEVVADEQVHIQSVVINRRSASDTGGFTQTIPVLPLDRAYSSRRTVAHLVVPKDASGRQATRHNLGIVNPNPVEITVELHDYDEQNRALSWNKIRVAALSAFQWNHYMRPFPPDSRIPVPPPRFGVFRVEAEADAPFYLYDSAVDNATNDATFIDSIPR